jgi:monoamine oxidase
LTHRKAEVAVIGGGAAGVAAARRLQDAGIDTLLIEARSRLGGRAFTSTESGFPLDLGCGWFHAAKGNPWPVIARQQGRAVDETPPPWQRPSSPIRFSIADQKDFARAREAFYERLESAELGDRDPPMSEFLEPGSRWNPLLDAVYSYVTGAEPEKVSTLDFRAYEDTEDNWRAPDGYGTVVAAYGAPLNVAFGCPVNRIDWGSTPLRVHSAQGVIEADRVIVALPSQVLAEQPEIFSPLLPAKTDAAAGLPLGLADKLYLLLEHAEEFEKDSRVFGNTDRAATAIYHMRPFGRPLIECYFGGSNADALERGGAAAFAHFATEELCKVFGNEVRRRIKPLPMHLWRGDPFARGSYSYAKPGSAGCRAVLAAPVDDRLFFAGEACSPHFFSTAHGAYESGVTAAEQVLKLR